MGHVVAHVGRPLGRHVVETELEGMRSANVAQIVLDAPAGLIGSVVGRRTPGGELGEIDRGKVLVAIDNVLDAYLVFPVFVHVGGETVLSERIFRE